MTLSSLVRKIIGIWHPPAPRPSSRIDQWVLEECSNGRFTDSIRAFESSQVEELDPTTLRVSAFQDHIGLSWSATSTDHESDKHVDTEVIAKLDPVTCEIVRLR